MHGAHMGKLVHVPVDIVVTWHEEETGNIDRSCLSKPSHKGRCQLVLVRLTGEGNVAGDKDKLDRAVFQYSLFDIVKEGFTGNSLRKLVAASSEVKVREVKPAKSIDQCSCPR